MATSDKEDQLTTDNSTKKQTSQKQETPLQKPKGYNQNTGEFIPF